MDAALQDNPVDGLSVYSLWDRAERLIPLLLSRLQPAHRIAVITAMFSQGLAVGWLTSVLRRETFAHGRFGDRARPENQWLLKNDEFGRAAELLMARYRKMSASDVFRCPDPLGLLFAWQQAGDENLPRQLIESATASDQGLVETLEHLTSPIVSSNRGKFNALKRSNLSPFMDFDSAVRRIVALKEDAYLGTRASRLAAAFVDGANQ